MGTLCRLVVEITNTNFIISVEFPLSILVELFYSRILYHRETSPNERLIFQSN